MTRPIVVLGLDGATWDVLDPLLAAGVMPTLARLRAAGRSGRLESVVPPITPAAWASFMTGKRPGKHGIYDFRVYDPRRYEDAFVTSRAIRDATVWTLLTAAGKRVGVVSLPMTYPPPAGAGTIVAGFDTPSTAAGFTAPPELRTRILGSMPDYCFVAVPDPADPTLVTDAAFARFVADAERACEQRTRVALDLLAGERLDVLMLHHQDTDAMQHLLWRWIADETVDPARTARIRQAYARLDARIAELLAAVPADALVLVVSDHGFGAHVGRVFPNVLLREWGYLSWRGRRRERLRRSVRKRLVRFGLATAPARDTASWGEALRTRSFAGTLPIAWRRTRAYVAVAEIYGLLYLNRRGREPEGVVDDASAPRLLDELAARFLAVRDGDAPVFSAVLRGTDVYPDDPHGRRPDLVLVPRAGLSVYRDLNPRLWLDRYPVLGGTHRPDGILLAHGDGVARGTLAHAAELVDVAPTILASAGVPVPADMDGRVLAELFVDPPAVAYAAPAAPAGDADAGLSADEEQEVTDRLRALGYMT